MYFKPPQEYEEKKRFIQNFKFIIWQQRAFKFDTVYPKINEFPWKVLISLIPKKYRTSWGNKIIFINGGKRFYKKIHLWKKISPTAWWILATKLPIIVDRKWPMWNGLAIFGELEPDLCQNILNLLLTVNVYTSNIKTGNK